nr:E-beta-farnesene synthase [Tanacetum cinerariifolium]
MADVNVNAPTDQAPTMAPPTCTDDQIMPHIRWVPIGKSNYYLDVERSQSNPIYKIAVDILKHTNFFKAFTASSTIPSIYIQQFGILFDMTKPPGFKRPRAPVLPILWGVVNRAHIYYAERIWEEFTQSIHTFIEDKRNLAQHTHGKKKATLIVISSVRFTKLIIYHLQSKHKFHPRPDSPLHLPNEEHVLGYLKFNANGTKQEVFGMPIPNKLITADIQGKPYYKEYLEKVTKHQRYLVGEKGSDPDSPAPKPAKATKKSKLSAPKADLRPPPSPARRSKLGLVTKRHKPTSSLRSVDESVDEGIPEKEPRFDDKEADVQRALEESLKSVYDVPWVSLPPVTPKKKSPADKFIFQRRTSTPSESPGHDDSSSLYAKLGLTDSEVASDEDVSGIDAGVQDEGQARPNPGEQDKGQARPNPGDVVTSQPQSSLVVHVGLNLEHMELEAADVSTQLHHKQMDEGFTATAYPNVQENLKLTVKEQVILEEPASSTGTLSSLQHLAKYLNFGDLFFNDKPFDADNKKTTAKTEVESMVSVTIQQDTSSIPPMTTLIIDLTSRPDSPNVHRPLQATATETTTTTTTTTTHPPPPQPQQSTTNSMLIKRIDELEQIMANLIQDNKHLEERLDSHGARLYTLENLDIHQQVSKAVDEIVTDVVDWAIQAPLQNRFRDLPEADMKEILHQRMWETNSYKAHEDHMILMKKEEKRRDSPKTSLGSSPHQPPPPPLPPAGPSITSGSPGASGSSQVLPAPSPPPSTNQEGQSHGSAAPSSSKTAAFAEYKAWTTTDTRLSPSVSSTPANLHMDDDMALDAHIHSSDDEDIRNAHIHKVNLRPALLISKMKAAYYPDVGLEQMVPDQMLIEEECKYDIAAMYGISHWWFQRQLFYIDRHTSEGDCRAVSTHMWILSVVRIKVFSMYGYDYMKKIVLHRADLNEHIIEKRDFKYMYPNNFEDMYLLNLQGFEYKHDYMVIDSPRAITFQDKYGVQMIIQFNEIHKFIDGNLHQIDEALDYRVKEFKVNRMNLGLNIRFWTRKDVDRSKEFMFAIQKRLKTRM